MLWTTRLNLLGSWPGVALSSLQKLSTISLPHATHLPSPISSADSVYTQSPTKTMPAHGCVSTTLSYSTSSLSTPCKTTPAQRGTASQASFSDPPTVAVRTAPSSPTTGWTSISAA